MKEFIINIDATSTVWETCSVLIEAETEEKALQLFSYDPWEYDWDHWDTNDSELKHWEIESIEEYPIKEIK